jgi:hypothetical protein
MLLGLFLWVPLLRLLLAQIFSPPTCCLCKYPLLLSLASLPLKLFQGGLGKAREAKEVHMDEILLADSMEALRPAQGTGFLSLIPSDPAKKVTIVSPVQD